MASANDTPQTSTITMTHLHGLRITPGQAREIGRLTELHRPDRVDLPTRQPVGITPFPVTLHCADQILMFRIDLGGNSWREGAHDDSETTAEAA